MLLTSIPGCSNLSKMTQDTLPSFPKATHLTVQIYSLLLIFHSTKTENLGQKKRFITFQLLIFMKIEQLNL